jgi:hypothetical protein
VVVSELRSGMVRIVILLVGIGVFLMAVTLQGAREDTKPALLFEAPISVTSQGDVTIRPQIENPSKTLLEKQDNFAGVMELRDLSDALLARVEVRSLGPLAANERVSLATWQTRLPPGTYRLTWGAPSCGSVVVAFKIVEKSGALSTAWVAQEHER